MDEGAKKQDSGRIRDSAQTEHQPPWIGEVRHATSSASANGKHD